jgi:MraZ protein
MFGPKLLDRLHSHASAETKPEKTATAFDQVAQVWAKPKGGSEEQEPPPAESTPSKKVDKEPAKAPDLPKDNVPANELLPPAVAVDEKVERSAKESAQAKEEPATAELRTPSLPDDPPPPQTKVEPEPMEKTTTRLRAVEPQPVDPPPPPPKNEWVKNHDSDNGKVEFYPAQNVKFESHPPQSGEASPPPVPEKRTTPMPQPAVEVPSTHDSIPAGPESRPPDVQDPGSSTIPPVSLTPSAANSLTPSATNPLTSPSTAMIRTTPSVKKAVAPAKAKALPLTGQHPCMLDDSRALVLPKSVRDQMGEADVLFLTPGADQALWLTTAASLEKLTDKMEKKTEGEEDGKLNRRRYFALTERVTVDKTGRLVLPAALATGAELKQEVVLVGVGDHVEVWDAGRWQKYCQAEGE